MATVYSHIQRYVETLTKNFSKDEKQTFELTFKETLTSSLSISSLIASDIKPSLHFHSIRMSLQAVQDLLDVPRPQPVGKYWNPTIAATLDLAEHMANQFKFGQTLTTQSSKHSKAKVVSSNQTSQQRVVNSPKPISKYKVPTSSSKPVSSVAPRLKPVMAPKLSDDLQPDYDSLTKRLSDGCLFDQPCHSHIHCNNGSCQFCAKMFKNVRLTRCIDVHAGDLCSESGFFPHVGHGLWRRMKKSHHEQSDWRHKASKLLDNERFSLSEHLMLSKTGPPTPDHTPKAIKRPISPGAYEPLSPEYQPDTHQNQPWSEDLDDTLTVAISSNDVDMV